MSDKRVWVLFGAKPAQSEAPARAAAERRPPEQGGVEEKKRSRLRNFSIVALKNVAGRNRTFNLLIESHWLFQSGGP